MFLTVFSLMVTWEISFHSLHSDRVTRLHPLVLLLSCTRACRFHLAPGLAILSLFAADQAWGVDITFCSCQPLQVRAHKMVCQILFATN